MIKFPDLKKIRSSGRILFFCIASIVCANVSSQTYFFEKYLYKEGLDQAKVYCILQDKNYQVWLGTFSGLSKFNGQTIQTITDKSLLKKAIKSLYQDSHGFIWIGYWDGGITRYDGQKFDSLPALNFQKTVSAFVEDDKGNIWFSSDGSGAICITNPHDIPQNIRFEQYLGNKLSDRVFWCMRTHDNKLYFVTDVGVKVFNPAKKTFENLILEGLSELALNFFQITTIFEDKDSNLWFGTYNGGLYQYNRKVKQLKPIKYYDIKDGLTNNWISCITQDKRGAIWIGTWLGAAGGLTRIDHNGIKAFGKQNGLPDHCIYSVVDDAEGNLLIGSETNGLLVFKGEAFVSYAGKEVLPNPQVFSILEDSNHNFWFGTNGGISIYNPNASSSNQLFKLLPGKEEDYAHPIPDNVRFIKEDKMHHIWVATVKNGIYEYNPQTKVFICPLFNFNLPGTKKINGLETDPSGDLWIATLDGLFYYNIAKAQLSRMSQEDGLAGSDISCIYVDDNDTKYVGVRNKGLTIFKDSLTLKSAKYPLLGNTTPNCCTLDAAGNLWIGTDNDGLLCFKDGKIVRHYEKGDGLLSDLIHSVITDNAGNVFVGTSLGLNKIDIKTKTIFTFTERNGFTGIEAKSNAVYKDREGNIWFGTANGAIKYNEKLDFTPVQEPLTSIRRLIVNKQETPMEQGLKLNYKKNAITFEYASVCINNPNAVEYQVMLKGLNDEWEPVSKQNFKEYSALQPGHYVFMVKAKNSAGIWNRNLQTYSFTINPPFYRTWWFITLCVLLATTGIIVYIKIREKSLIREKEILEQTVKERTAEVVEKNEELALKNKDIMDSILYASRIQGALLPPELPFDNTFVFFRPKDVVSGDFFWFIKGHGLEWLSAVDCTGHGVPGAFMSIIGHNSLNKIVRELDIREPAKILNQLDVEVIRTLNQYKTDSTIRDGMDIALVCYDPQQHILQFAGGCNPLYLVRKGELLETRANRYAIGMSETQKDFTNYEIPIESGDTIYIFSDGFADQFGGPSGKKLKVGAFKECILGLQAYPMSQQKEMIDKFFTDWVGHREQVDDVTVIGRRFEF